MLPDLKIHFSQFHANILRNNIITVASVWNTGETGDIKICALYQSLSIY